MSDSSAFRELETSLGPTLKGGGEGILELDLRNLRIFTGLSILSRQNGAPSGLEKRGLDASIYHKTKKPTEGTQ
ncbi:hypothetical protein [Leptospira borgpetersenii]|uniref:hypothetical protein n=1 Tax=Leptospira borgpetersenii TaxID=174 RepID=UPI003974CA31